MENSQHQKALVVFGDILGNKECKGKKKVDT